MCATLLVLCHSELPVYPQDSEESHEILRRPARPPQAGKQASQDDKRSF